MNQTAWERIVIEIVASILDRPVDGNTDFFECGGDSLSALAVQETLQQKIGKEIDIQALYETYTLSEFVSELIRGDQPNV